MKKILLTAADFYHGQSLPTAAGKCVFQADRVVLLDGDVHRVNSIALSRGHNLFGTRHSTLVQRLLIGLENDSELCLEMTVEHWFDPRGRPSEPWRKLRDLGHLLAREYKVPLREETCTAAW
ncbi:MAG: hypothetical protein U0931_21240 [Vulcanimicrobiota bacterium]